MAYCCISSLHKVSCYLYFFQYPCNDIYADLVPRDDSSNRPFWELTAQEVGTQELFRSPLTSFLYERGWRQNFQTAGFPGIDKEFDELMEFLGEEGTPMNYTIVDMSCGSGLMTRRLVRVDRWGFPSFFRIFRRGLGVMDHALTFIMYLLFL